MTKYVNVKTVPDRPLEKDEYVVRTPNFVTEVRECRCRLPGTGTLSPFYLRAIADHIGNKFDPKFPGSGTIVVNDYNGVPFKSIEDVAAIVVRMFRRFYPKIFEAAIEHQIKGRPFGTKLIYFVGDHLDSAGFAQHGIDAISEKDIDTYLGRKEKKPGKGIFKKSDDLAIPPSEV